MPAIKITVERSRILVRLAVSATLQSQEKHIEGLLDTGATQSFVTSDLIQQIQPTHAGTVQVTSIDTDSGQRPTFVIHVRVPAPQLITEPASEHFRGRIVAVAAQSRFDGRHSSTPCDMLIGMDLISRWNIKINNGICTIKW